MSQGVPGCLRPQILLTFRHYKSGRSSTKRTGRFYPRINPWYLLSEAVSTSGHVVLSGGATEKKSPVAPPVIDPGTFRLVAQCLNHYAIILIRGRCLRFLPVYIKLLMLTCIVLPSAPLSFLSGYDRVRNSLQGGI